MMMMMNECLYTHAFAFGVFFITCKSLMKKVPFAFQIYLLLSV